MKSLLLLILFVGIVAFGPAITPDVVSVQSGNWDEPTTWNPAIVPDSTKTVKVCAGHVVTLRSNVSCKNLISEGTNSFSGNFIIFIKGQ